MDNIVNALALKSADYKENDKMVTLFTADYGKVTAIMRGVKKKGAKLKFATQVFNYGEYEFATIGNTNIVTGCNQLESFFKITKDVESFYAASVATELLLNLSVTEKDSKDYFSETLKFFTLLKCDGVNNRTLLGKYLYNIAQLEGYAVTDISILSQNTLPVAVIELFDMFRFNTYIEIAQIRDEYAPQKVMLKLFYNFYVQHIIEVKALEQMIKL
ncbi:MAG: DNA repair protein RecO [Clostridia bacterium]